MENPFGTTDPRRISLKDEAHARAMSYSPSSDLGSSGFVSDHSATPSSPPHPLQENSMPFSSPQMAMQARKDWQTHGEGLTQALEEKRRHTEEFLLQGGAMMGKPGTLSVRVFSAEKRVDLAGQKYSAYVIRVQFPSPSPSAQNGIMSNLVEHRYSDFAKLNDIFKKHNVVMDKTASFPGKSWVGRVGNWTPSLTWAPDKHDELINFRVIQLDCWLVHVVRMYNLGVLPMEVAQALYEFLAAPSKPPCQNNNDLEAATWKWNNPISFTLGSGVRQAARTVQYMCQDPYKLNQSDQSIPLDLLHAAKGLFFMTVVKAGLVVSGRIGTGVLVARLDDGVNGNQNIRWSAPCAIGTVGMGWGALMGADVTHYLVVLTTTKAVHAICGSTSVQLGAEMGVAVGPIGRGANSHLAYGDWTLHPAYAYAHSQGLFVGMSLEGSVVSVRSDVNTKFYGRQVSAKELLNLPGPKAAEPLYRALEGAMKEHIPEEGFRPSTLWNNNGACTYENHPQRPPNYTNQHSPMPPPMIPVQSCFQSSAIDTPPQDAGSGSMESYHQSSNMLPISGYASDQTVYHSTRPQTIETMGSGPQPLFDACSPSSTVGSGHHW